MKLKTICAAAALCLTATAQAASYDSGDGTAFDPATGLMALTDTNLAGTTHYIDETGLLNFEESLVWADDLVFAGFDDWRLPTINERLDLTQPGVFTNLQEMHYYWLTGEGLMDNGSTITFTPGWAGLADPQGLVMYAAPKDVFHYALAVRDHVAPGADPYAGSVGAIPEPSTYALMLAGLGLVGWAARKRR